MMNLIEVNNDTIMISQKPLKRPTRFNQNALILIIFFNFVIHMTPCHHVSYSPSSDKLAERVQKIFLLYIFQSRINLISLRAGFFFGR